MLKLKAGDKIGRCMWRNEVMTVVGLSKTNPSMITVKREDAPGLWFIYNTERIHKIEDCPTCPYRLQCIIQGGISDAEWKKIQKK